MKSRFDPSSSQVSTNTVLYNLEKLFNTSVKFADDTALLGDSGLLKVMNGGWIGRITDRLYYWSVEMAAEMLFK